MSYIKELQYGLKQLLKDNNTFLLGEDIVEPYGGAFKVTKDLSLEYPDQVIATPMSEQGFTGMGIGMALAGQKVMIEIMFGDFITLCADQIINHASKFVGLYDKKLHFVLRTPMGGYRGYGATHSQTLEKLFLGIPDLFLVSPSIAHNPGILLQRSLDLGKPVIFIENKLDYTRYMINEIKDKDDYDVDYSENSFPIVKVKMHAEDQADILLICYGGMLADAIEIQKSVYMEDEVSLHIMSPSLLYPVQKELISKAIAYNSIIILEESYGGGSWSAEITALLFEAGFKGNIKRVSASLDTIGASESLEFSILPTKDDVLKTIMEFNNG